MCIVCVCACALLSRSLVTPRHRCIMMHEVDAYKAILSLRRNPIEDGAISGFSGQNSVPEYFLVFYSHF